MNLKNLFALDYWFGQPESARGSALWILVGGFLLVIVIGLLMKIFSQYTKVKSDKTVMSKFAMLGLAVGFSGLVWMFFRQEGVWFLGWRWWLVLLLVFFIWRLYKIINYLTKRVPKIKKEEAERARIEKYLPHRK
ncbi:MAG: hypothetical protein AAB348_01885 [Patescibacteria group bacterium]